MSTCSHRREATLKLEGKAARAPVTVSLTYLCSMIAACCSQSGTLSSFGALMVFIGWQEGYSACKNVLLHIVTLGSGITIIEFALGAVLRTLLTKGPCLWLKLWRISLKWWYITLQQSYWWRCRGRLTWYVSEHWCCAFMMPSTTCWRSVFESVGMTFSSVQGAYKSWKVVEFKIQIFQAWKVMELGRGPGKSWKMNQMVAAFLTRVHVLRNFGLHIFQFWTPHFSILTSHFDWTPHLN